MNAYMKRETKPNAERTLSIDENELLVLAQNGSEEAFTQLVERYQNPVYNLCYRMLGEPTEAEDAAQESFWRAYQAIRRYDRSRPFATWLLSITAHYCIDQQRKRRLPTLEIEDWMEEVLPDNTPDPEKMIGAHEEKERIHRMLSTLNPQDRAAIILRYWYEFSEEEISQALQLSVSAVKSRLHRARLKFASLYQADRKLTPGGIHDESPAF
ncbi:MAG TPA: RNA polymerase subunit sigma-24 [Anaerolineaceae bacterium]|nr:RNA polymerase subunit sigma-24 [Anaerolineaceae bacterium]HBA91913.1 RNA polymerase subunit sigma-24 [Anaerolineaceae bacterium]